MVDSEYSAMSLIFYNCTIYFLILVRAKNGIDIGNIKLNEVESILEFRGNLVL